MNRTSGQVSTLKKNEVAMLSDWKHKSLSMSFLNIQDSGFPPKRDDPNKPGIHNSPPGTEIAAVPGTENPNQTEIASNPTPPEKGSNPDSPQIA
ncbi:hypothetical protein [Anabaena sp. CCY 9910]|uniref:hypothetical protein n=1 Tax=Anabaena sp. CCY 9910 TaxID=3103870 RepID=UPI0039E17BAE